MENKIKFEPFTIEDENGNVILKQNSFEIPSGKSILVSISDERRGKKEFSVTCEKLDNEKVRVGYTSYTLQEYAETLKHIKATCRPEPVLTVNCALWRFAGRGYIHVFRNTEGHWQYQFLTIHKTIKKEGVLDNEFDGLSINDARDKILCAKNFRYWVRYYEQDPESILSTVKK